MERINKWAVMPKRGEVPENILKHDELFEVPFGATSNQRQLMGDRHRTSENPGVVCIEFEAPMNTETNVGYGIQLSGIAEAIYSGKIWLMISEEPWAIPGDPGNICEVAIGPSDLTECLTFVSDDGKDPREATIKGYVPKPGGGITLGDIPVPKRPDGGLRPGQKYYYTMRLIRDTGKIMVLNVVHHGSDNPDEGGEVPLSVEAPATTPVVPVAPVGEGEGLRMFNPIDGGPGVFIPD